MQDIQPTEIIELLTKENERLKQDVELFQGQIQWLKSTQAAIAENTEKVRQWTIDKIESGEIEQDIAQELASLMGFDIKQEFEVTIQVEYTFTVKAATNSDVEDIIDGLDLPTLSGEEIEEYRVYGELLDRSYTTI